MTGTTRRAGAARRMALALTLTAGLGIAVGTLTGGPAFASAGTGETATSPTGTGTSGCPSINPPNEMTLVTGTPQTALLGSGFAAGLQVALSNSDGCPVTSAAAGIPVTFTAPNTGASGVFSTTGSYTATVGADVSGMVAAPAFTADEVAGSYTVTASSQYGSVSFSLTNTAAGIAAKIAAIALKSRSARVTNRYTQPLQVRVLDSDGNPVAGTTVTFTLQAGASSVCGTTTSGAGATFTGGGAQATAMTNANGVASSPAFTANGVAGSFTATAAAAGREPTGGSGKENPGASGSGAAAPVSFALSNLAGTPVKLATGVGSTQSTLTGTPFAIRLAVTVTDAEKNPVGGAEIAFTAPARGASGRFTIRSPDSRHHRSHISHSHTARIRTNACGIALAPAFTADRLPGGYIVEASVKYARPAAFALVNETPGQSR
jgi:hypothetical protein